MLNPGIFKAYDIRGVYNEDFSKEDLPLIAKGIYKFFVDYFGRKDLRITLGRDMRVFSPEMYEFFLKTLLNYPVEIIELDLVSTPAMYYSALKFGADAGIHLTASHNPAKYQGIKFFLRKGDRIVKISGNFGMEDVKKNVLNQNFVEEEAGKGSSVKKLNFDKVYVEDTLEYFGKFSPKRNLKIVVDSANGMGILYLKPFFEKYSNYQVFYLNEELDGTFPNHEADPLKPENLRQLQEAVSSEKADLGIAPDGDGDRIFFVDERAEIISPTRVTSLIADEVFSQNKADRVVIDVRYVRNLEKICKKYGKQMSVCRVGHSFITQQVNDDKAFFAGESSGHFYFYGFGGAENSLLVLLYILQRLEEEPEKKTSKIFSEVDFVSESGEYNFKLPEGLTAEDLFEKLKERYSEARIVSIDGFTAEFNNWRFNFRASNTEPLVRLNLEADTKELMKQKLEEVIAFVESLGAKRE